MEIINYYIDEKKYDIGIYDTKQFLKTFAYLQMNLLLS